MKTKNFHGNLADDLHCFQACYWMAINTLLNKTPCMDEVEQETGFRSGWPTWPFAGMLSFAKQNCECIYIENTDYAAFVTSAEEVLLKQSGDAAIVQEVLTVTDLPLEISRVAEILTNPHTRLEKRVPTIEDIKQLIADGWFCMCNVNARRLRNAEGYCGHMVVIEEIGNNTLTLQNPGSPAHPNQVVDYDTFKAAWNFPNENMANIIAIRVVKETA
jgi:hypothetical protein